MGRGCIEYILARVFACTDQKPLRLRCWLLHNFPKIFRQKWADLVCSCDALRMLCCLIIVVCDCSNTVWLLTTIIATFGWSKVKLNLPFMTLFDTGFACSLRFRDLQWNHEPRESLLPVTSLNRLLGRHEKSSVSCLVAPSTGLKTKRWCNWRLLQARNQGEVNRVISPRNFQKNLKAPIPFSSGVQRSGDARGDCLIGCPPFKL